MNNPLYGAKKRSDSKGSRPPRKVEASANPNRPNKIKGHKGQMHPRSKHLGSYDFDKLIEACPELKPFVFTNEHQTQTIKFDDAEAVKALNKALLALYYGIDNWTIPPGYLCPPIPGRVDYIHYIQDLIGKKEHQVRGIDIGVGANCIYPLLGASEYDWNFVGIDISNQALINGQKILLSNPQLMDKIDLRHQPNPKSFFKGVIRQGERFDFVMCNPPFHASPEEADAAAKRKVDNLAKNKAKRSSKSEETQNSKKSELNFGGQSHELWCEGGELNFIQNFIQESIDFGGQARVFTCLVSKEENVGQLRRLLYKLDAKDVQVVEMGQGQKKSRFIAWRFAPKLGKQTPK